MSIVRLSPTSYVVLGMVAVRGPSTPYEIKRAIGRSVGYFWPFPHAQIYAETERLAGAHLLSERREAGGRRRRTYSLTSSGSAALRRWLRQPVSSIWEIRDEAQLKLFFGEQVDDGAIVQLAAQQRRLHEQRLQDYRALRDRMTDRSDIEHRMAPLGMGLVMEHAAVRFWRDMAVHPPRRSRPRVRAQSR